MKKKTFLLQLCIIALSCSIYAQSIYELEYTSRKNPFADKLTAMLVRFSNGTGYARVRYIDTRSNSDVILNLKLAEDPFINQKGMPDPDAFVLRTFDPERINPGMAVDYIPDSFVFHIDSTNRYFDPWKVYNPAAEIVLADFSTPPISISPENIVPYIKKYFKPGEAIYDQYVKAGSSRGGPAQDAPGKGITLHLIIVAATEDTKIGKASIRDIENIKFMYRNIRRTLGITNLNLIVLDGDKYDQKLIADTINSLKPGKNDIVAFHYTGHGINDMKPRHDYPNMLIVKQASDWKKIAELPQFSLSIEEIYKAIVKKGARLNLVFSDCCNSNLLENKDYRVGHLENTGRDEGRALDPEKCKKLFIDQKISILAIAARKSEYARTGIDGGIFTFSFIKSLEANLSGMTQNKKALPAWKNVFDTTIAKTNYYKAKVCSPTPDEPCPYQMTPLFNVGAVKPVPVITVAHK